MALTNWTKTEERGLEIEFTFRSYGETWSAVGDAFGWQVDVQGQRALALLSPKMQRQVMLAGEREADRAHAQACVEAGPATGEAATWFAGLLGEVA